ncbi:MAG: tetratricopeptide repeat protein, partial [Desulfobacteraceae bacterium]|nr:tetratricopeptide repeat protein [Desulfobacteraceae bacterium]
DDASELYKEAFALFQKGEFDKAIQVLEDEKLDKLFKAAQDEKRKAQERLAKSEEAVQKSIDNYILKARMCKSRFQFDEAEKNYRKAVEGDSENFYSISEFAYYLTKQNKYPQAILLYEKALSLAKGDSETSKTLNNLGGLYYLINRHGDAEKHITEL